MSFYNNVNVLLYGSDNQGRQGGRAAGQAKEEFPGFTKYSAEISSHDNWFKRFFISFNNPDPRGYFILA